MILCVHWILSGIYSPYVTGYHVEENSNFCRINSHLALIAGTMELCF